MGLQSALTTALTGLSAAEAQIDVIGNNLANAQTVGFKSSKVAFATQFLQTLGLGSAPSADNGGTNPRQTGLGVQVAEITPNFSQGTVEVSTNPSDLAIQGDGFFMVEGPSGERLYSRNGIFKINSDSELVTLSGNRLLGFGINDNFELQTTQLEPIQIAIGGAAVAQATQNVQMEGVLTPIGDIANTAGVIESARLTDSAVPRADGSAVGVDVAPLPVFGGSVATSNAAGSLTGAQTYQYRLAFADASGTESVASGPISATLGATDNQVTLTGLPTSTLYSQVRIYRRDPSSSDFQLLDSVATGTANYVDDGSLTPGTAINDANLTGNYSYLITYHRTGQEESRPSLLIGPQNVSDGRLRLDNIPAPPVPPPQGGFPAYDQIRVYRNLASDASNFYLVTTLSPGDTFTDNRTDTEISDLNNPANKLADLDGPRVNSSSFLTNILKRDGLDYENMFPEGSLTFSGRKGGRSLDEKQFTVTTSSTIQDLIDFMEDSTGIRGASDDPQNPVPGSLNNIPGETSSLSAGGSVVDGKIRFVSNNGVDNALSIGISGLTVLTSSGNTVAANLGFGSVQDAKGQSAVTDFVAYDSLGIPLNVRVTSILESRTGSETVYRWFADSADNDPVTGSKIGVGTGLISLDGEGNVIGVSNATVSIDRRNVPSNSPLEFDLDFDNVSGLAANTATLSATGQDGSPPGSLSSYQIQEDGTIRGSFTNGLFRPLGQIRLARFSNPAGLEQRGLNNYAEAANSGLPIQGNPGESGIGNLISGAVELSNTDVGKDLINLVLATTQYRGNARVISASQQLLEELLNLRR